MSLNILAEDVFRFKRNDGRIGRASLPEVYALLMANDIASFPALRPHQKHAWHAFLVQLGTMATHNAGLTEPPTDPGEWRRIIRLLTADFPGDEPWCLVVDDITSPAFMQPPASSAELGKEYKDELHTPDELDMLVTAKNHDLKVAIGELGDVNDWLFALITLQTMDGNPGRNPGIARMNGAYGSRPSFSLAPVAGVGTHVKRDITVLLEHRPTLIKDYPMTDGGVGLVWTQKWDGTSAEALTLNELDPFFIEICRRLRLSDDEGLYAIKATAKHTRIEAKTMNGRVGDPWTPINLNEGKSLTLPVGGFTYKRIVDYLRDWDNPILLRGAQSDPEDMALLARATVRGQGKTEGHYERVIPINRKVRRAMMTRASTQELGHIAKERVDDVGKVQSILRYAVSVFAAGGGDSIAEEHRNRAKVWVDRLDKIVDATFFDDLQVEFEAGDSAERRVFRDRWLRNGDGGDGVIDHARKILHDAEEALPCNGMRRYKARTQAEGVFEGMIRSGSRGFPDLF